MINYIATATFGLEACVKREVIKLGFENVRTFDGRVEDVYKRQGYTRRI